MKYAIVDEANNTLFTGTEEEMETAFRILAWTERTLKNMHQESRLTELKAKYKVPHTGKVKMIPYAE